MRWILTLVAMAGLWVVTCVPHLLASWKDSLKQFFARSAGDWPLYLFSLNGIIVSGLVFVELAWSIGSAGSATQSNTMDPPVENESTAREKK